MIYARALIATATFPLLLAGCSEPLSSGDQSAPAPGIYKTAPEGIGEIKGNCSGKIALTPGRFASTGFDKSYAVIFDCEKKEFEILASGDPLAPGTGLGDLTLTKTGHYVHEFRTIDLVRTGGYTVYDLKGKKTARIERQDLDAHDILFESDSTYYIKYTPARKEADCTTKVRTDAEIIQEDRSGSTIWSWSSHSAINTDWKVTTADQDALANESPWKKYVRPIRHCVTALAGHWFTIQTPSLFILPGKWPLLQLEQDDYVHVNSIQHRKATDDILISARHLDTVFLVDKKSGKISWALGGQYSKMTANRPVNDPRNGFSHQHSAYIEDQLLYIYDNGNNYPNLPSRAVAYQIDSNKPDKAVFKFEIIEPNKVKRPALGYVRPVGTDRIIIGWGGVLPKDRGREQRAVSVFNLKTGEEEFSLNLAANWVSYRAKHFVTETQ